MELIKILKNNLSSLIYSSACIEGISCDFNDTEAIITNGTARNVSEKDINIILGLKDAWMYLFEHYAEHPTYEHFANYNYFIQSRLDTRAGKNRTEAIVITNCDYIPEPVSPEYFNNILDTVINTFNIDGEKALALLFLLCKAQFFWDGNKRTSQLLVNHLLAYLNSSVYLLIPEGEEENFLEYLIEFYEGIMSLDDVTWIEEYTHYK